MPRYVFFVYLPQCRDLCIGYHIDSLLFESSKKVDPLLLGVFQSFLIEELKRDVYFWDILMNRIDFQCLELQKHLLSGFTYPHMRHCKRILSKDFSFHKLLSLRHICSDKCCRQIHIHDLRHIFSLDNLTFCNDRIYHIIFYILLIFLFQKTVKIYVYDFHRMSFTLNRAGRTSL